MKATELSLFDSNVLLYLFVVHKERGRCVQRVDPDTVFMHQSRDVVRFGLVVYALRFDEVKDQEMGWLFLLEALLYAPKEIFCAFL